MANLIANQRLTRLKQERDSALQQIEDSQDMVKVLDAQIAALEPIANAPEKPAEAK